MLVFTNTETRLCRLVCQEVTVVITHKDPLLTGVGGMLIPRHAGALDVRCPHAGECAGVSRDCVWAVGIMRSKNDPIGLKVKL